MGGFVYKWYNTENDMYYIGSHGGSVDDKYIGSGIYFKRAYKKNPDCFFREIMYEGEHYIIYEQTILQYLDAKNDPNYYNLTNSAIYRPLGRKSAEDTRIKISKGNKGKNKGAVRTKEHRHKISVSLKGRKKSLEVRKNMSQGQKKPVYCGVLNKEFSSIEDCAKALNKSYSSISGALRGRLKNKYQVKYIKK